MTEEKILWKDQNDDQKKEYLASTLPDCSFIAGTNDNTQTFSSYRWILTEASPVFERMLNGDFKEAKSDENISLPDDDPLVFSKFLNYIYTGQYRNYCPTMKFIMSLYYMGKKYLLQELMDGCLQFIKSKRTQDKVNQKPVPFIKFNEDDLVCMFEFFETIDDAELLNDVTNTMQYTLSEHTRRQSIIKNSSINLWSMATFYKLLKAVKSNYVREIERYNMIAAYEKINGLVIDENEIRRETVQEKTIKEINSNGSVNDFPVTLKIIYNSIDYLKMTPMEFIFGPGTTNLFSSFQKYELLADIIRINN